ncbi:hypothetical protein [Hyphomonas sp.]|uniref:hypothetical protein n=1 Tax=Hyphomonas sp. TaxID=87 RepID=UPI0025C45991|nr:hypothetical protein [Hyphomonas sp.]
MAYYAFINENNMVYDIITGVDENDKTSLPKEFNEWEDFYKAEYGAYDCKRTSYNTSGNKHKDGGTGFRGNYAGLGDTYDKDNDVFIAPKPTADATLNEETWLWEIS